MKPLCIDLYCGLGGWTEGFLAEGYECIGFDLERHDYGTGGYPGQLVLQDVLTLDGAQFKDAAVIAASPPCQAYSYMAMPWKRAKVMAAEITADATGQKLHELNALFNACFRIQREASEAAGHHIPLIVENVKGAQLWVGKAKWHFGSFYLWGDVPALMPLVKLQKFNPDGTNHPPGSYSKNRGSGSWFAIGSPGQKQTRSNPVNGVKLPGNDTFKKDGKPVPRMTQTFGVKVAGGWFGSYADMKASGTISSGRLHGKNSAKRKAASAQIAKIPFPLAQHIARCFKPHRTLHPRVNSPADSSNIPRMESAIEPSSTSGH